LPFETKDFAQIAVAAIAPFVAVGGAVILAAQQRRERIACFISWGYARGMDGAPEEAAYLGVHNLTLQSVAINRVDYLGPGPYRKRQSRTAIYYEDPFEVAFPYLVKAGEIRNIRIDESQGTQLALTASRLRYAYARIFKRHRILLECETTTGRRRRIKAELVLDWKDRAPWLQNV
jgi:hypothetical protein